MGKRAFFPIMLLFLPLSTGMKNNGFLFIIILLQMLLLTSGQNETNISSVVPTEIVTSSPETNISSEVPTEIVTSSPETNISSVVPTEIVTSSPSSIMTSPLSGNLNNISSLAPSDSLDCIPIERVGYLTDISSWEMPNHTGLDNVNRQYSPANVTKEFLIEPSSTEHGYCFLEKKDSGSSYYSLYNFTDGAANEKTLNFILQSNKSSDFHVVAAGQVCTENNSFILESLTDYNSGMKGNNPWKMTLLFVLSSIPLFLS